MRKMGRRREARGKGQAKAAIAYQWHREHRLLELLESRRDVGLTGVTLNEAAWAMYGSPPSPRTYAEAHDLLDYLVAAGKVVVAEGPDRKTGELRRLYWARPKNGDA